jgi:glycosyltransferase involved in cell wall biosynthesis
MEKVSGVVVCYNNMPYIENCLKSMSWVDELIVVDSFSSDGTDKLAEKYADKFIRHQYISDGAQKNFAFSQASFDWVVVIDSDEIMPEALRDEIRQTLENPRYGYYQVYRRGIFLGKEMRHGGWNRDKNYLLLRSDRYRFNSDEVHQRLIPEDSFGIFRNRLIHYTHRSVDEFVRKSNNYATRSAAKYHRGGRKGHSFRILLHPSYNFLKVYFLRLGLLDGSRGLISATLSSAYVAEKYAKLWEYDHRREIAGDSPGLGAGKRSPGSGDR